MEAKVDEVADGIYRLSTWMPEIGRSGFTFSQSLLDAEEPLLYHTGMRQLFPLVSDAVASVVPLDRLRWIAFSHVEADECDAMEQFLAAAPRAQVAHGVLRCDVSLDDLLSRKPVRLGDGDVLDLRGKELRARRVRHLDTPHVPHNSEARVLFEEETRTLLAGDLGTQLGNPAPLVDADALLSGAAEAEQMFRQASLGPAIPATLRRLAELAPSTPAVMHGASFDGDGQGVLRAVADMYEQLFPAECLPGTASIPGQGRPGAHPLPVDA